MASGLCLQAECTPLSREAHGQHATSETKAKRGTMMAAAANKLSSGAVLVGTVASLCDGDLACQEGGVKWQEVLESVWETHASVPVQVPPAQLPAALAQLSAPGTFAS